MDSPKQGRIYYLDVLRTIACMLVVMLHCAAKYMVCAPGSANFFTGNLLDSLSRVCVPLFVMISGALALDEERQFTFAVTKRRVLKLAVFFIFWSAVYCLVYRVLTPVLEGGKPGLGEAAAAFIKGHVHLWFVYMIIGLYLITPLLRLWVRDENKRAVNYFLLLALVFGSVLPLAVNTGLVFNSGFRHIEEILNVRLDLKYVAGYTMYFILGWYLNRYPVRRYRALYLAGALGAAVTVLGTLALSLKQGKLCEILYDFTGPFVLAQAAAVFVWVKRACGETGENRCVTLVSRLSLGIYGVHVLLISAFYSFLPGLLADRAYFVIPAAFALTFVSSCALSWLMGRLPLLKRAV